ncbi:MAG: FAD-dependent oxidoreductase, partial [archaeon]|nr:FAD-dependent oxidoreductase [archaeon]
MVAFYFVTVGEVNEEAVDAYSGKKTIVIIGGGLAGLSAALEAAELTEGEETRIVLLEKEGQLGGNSGKSSSGMNSVGTRTQEAAGVEDSPELFAHDTVLSGQGLSDLRLVEVLSARALSAFAFVENTTGLR